MKKIFTTLLLALGISAATVAQNISYGVKAGVNFSDWRGDASASIQELIDLAGFVDTRPNVGFHFGGHLIIPVNEMLTLEPGVLYAQKGMQITEILEDKIFLPIQAKAVVKSHYLDIPIMAKVKVAQGFQVFAGPQVSYLMANRLKTKAGILGFNVQENFPIDAGFRKFDVALAGGLGYQFANGTNISASYEHGLNSIDDGGFFNAYNRVLKASVGFVIK